MISNRVSIQFGSTLISSYVAYATALFNAGKRVDAVDVLRRGADLDPADQSVQYMLGVSLSEQDKADEASIFHQLTRLDPTSPLGHVGLGDILSRQHKLDPT